jgi:hypothetical protein
MNWDAIKSNPDKTTLTENWVNSEKMPTMEYINK